VLDYRLREPNQKWMRKNYVSNGGKLFVAGKKLGNIPPEGAISFHTLIPARYAIVSKKGPLSGTLDGQPIAASRWLEPGSHHLQFAPGTSGHVAFVWAQAAERGFSPFVKRASEPRG
jgi:hypothetical protein